MNLNAIDEHILDSN